MSEFGGFPSRMEFTPVPNVFINRIAPRITDLAEMKVTLHLFSLLYRKRGYPRFVTHGELLADTALMIGLRHEEEPAEEVLRRGLDLAVARGTILRLTLTVEDHTEEVYFINTEADRHAVARIQSGELALQGLKAPPPPAEAAVADTPNIFTVYEQNIGMLTPMIADELRDAEAQYPEDWIKDAIHEAASLKKTSWRYIARILERWAAEGRGEVVRPGRWPGDHSERYRGQRYGHLFRR